MPTIVETENPRKISNITPVTSPGPASFTNLSFPYRQELGADRFSKFHERLRKYRRGGEFKIPPPGEGLPRILHFCADQSGCAFWRMIWPGDELMSHNKAVVMTFYQMIQHGGFYQGIDAIRLQRQCTAHQLEFIKFLRTVTDQMKAQTGKGFRIIWEVDDLIFADLVPDYNVCKTGFLDPNIEKTVKEAVHLCVDKDTEVFCIVDNFPMEITVEELKEHFDAHRKISILSKNVDTNVGEFKRLENCWVTSEEAEVVEVHDEASGYKIICTPDHPIYTKNRGWVEAGSLESTDVLDVV